MSFISGVLLAEKPEFTRFFLPHLPCQQPRAVAAVKRADPWAGLSENGVVGSDGEVADDVEHMPSAYGEACHHRHYRLGGAAHLDLQVQHIQAADAFLRHFVISEVAVIAPDSLVAA